MEAGKILSALQECRDLRGKEQEAAAVSLPVVRKVLQCNDRDGYAVE